MIIRKWLTITGRGGAKLSTYSPTIKGDEIAIRLELNIPNALFTKPRIVAQIKVSEEAVNKEVITAEVIDNIEDAIKQATDLTLNVKVLKEENVE